MGYTGERKREYQREWVAARRAAYFEDKACVKCSSTSFLELDHVDRSTKVANSIWSWSVGRQQMELAKCQVLCKSCHLDKTMGELRQTEHGSTLYRNGCRCRVCRDAQRDRARRLRKQKASVAGVVE